MLNILTKFFTINFFCSSVYIHQYSWRYRIYFAVTWRYTYNIYEPGKELLAFHTQIKHFCYLKRPNGTMFPTFDSYKIVIVICLIFSMFLHKFLFNVSVTWWSEKPGPRNSRWNLWFKAAQNSRRMKNSSQTKQWPMKAFIFSFTFISIYLFVRLF